MPERDASIINGLARIIANACSVLLTETDCQSSYPLNSENASPPGTDTVYLSCAAITMLTAMASSTTTNPQAGRYSLFSPQIFKMRNMHAPKVIPRSFGANFAQGPQRAPSAI